MRYSSQITTFELALDLRFPLPSIESHCDLCDNPTNRCSSCRKSWYCSEKCQKRARSLHIFNCTPGRPINTAYYLYQAVALDMIPGHPQTCEAHGFNRVPKEEEGKLVWLYTGLIKYLGISPDELHQWRKQAKGEV